MAAFIMRHLISYCRPPPTISLWEVMCALSPPLSLSLSCCLTAAQRFNLFHGTRNLPFPCVALVFAFLILFPLPSALCSLLSLFSHASFTLFANFIELCKASNLKRFQELSHSAQRPERSKVVRVIATALGKSCGNSLFKYALMKEIIMHT